VKASLTVATCNLSTRLVMVGGGGNQLIYWLGLACSSMLRSGVFTLAPSATDSGQTDGHVSTTVVVRMRWWTQAIQRGEWQVRK